MNYPVTGFTPNQNTEFHLSIIKRTAEQMLQDLQNDYATVSFLATIQHHAIQIESELSPEERKRLAYKKADEMLIEEREKENG